MAFAFPFKFCASIRIAALQRELRFQAMQLSSLAGVTGGMLMTVALALSGFGVTALAGGFVVNAVFECISATFCVRDAFRAKLNLPSARHLFKFSAPYLLSQCMNYLALQGPMYITGQIGGVQMLGMLNRAATLQAVPVNFVAGVGSKIAFASVSKMQSEPDKLRRLLLTAIEVNGLVLLPLSIGAALISKVLVKVTLGEQWAAAAPCLSILAFCLFARVGYVIPETTLVALGRVGSSARRQAVYGVVSASAVLVGVMTLGLVGAALGMGIGILTFYVLSIVALNDVVGKCWKHYLKLHFRGGAIAAPCLALAYLCPHGEEIADQLVRGLTYFVALGCLYLLLPARVIGELAEIRTALGQKMRNRLGYAL